jgi:hypothetical protein
MILTGLSAASASKAASKMFSFNSSKKAQGMSLNVVVVAVIAIVILVVLIVIFSGKTRLFTKTLADCEAKGGTCQRSCGIGEISHVGTNCASDPDGKTKCCARIEGKAPTPTTPETSAPNS